MQSRRCLAALMTALLFLGGPAVLAAAVKLDDARVVETIAEAVSAIRRGNPETAINRHLQPLIDAYDRQYKGERRRIYSARSPAESLVYVGLHVAEVKESRRKTGAIVVTGLWAEALYQKAYALVELERFDEARVTLKSLLQLAPLHSAGWSELGVLHQEAHEWPEALAAYVKAEEGAAFMGEGAEEQYFTARALRGQGYVLIETGKLDEAEALYRRCLEMDANDQTAKQELAYIAQQRRRSAPGSDDRSGSQQETGHTD